MVKHQIVSQELFIRQKKSGKPWGGKTNAEKNPLVEVMEVSNMAGEENGNQNHGLLTWKCELPCISLYS